MAVGKLLLVFLYAFNLMVDFASYKIYKCLHVLQEFPILIASFLKFLLKCQHGG